MHTPTFFVELLYFITIATVIDAQTCYFPNGAEAVYDTPCRATLSEQAGQASAYCSPSDACLDNNLCLGQTNYGNVLAKGTCTDHNWQSSDCAQYCQDGKSQVLLKTDSRLLLRLIVRTEGGVLLFPFTKAANVQLFCCGPGNSTSGTCSQISKGSVEPFFIPAGRVIFNRTSGSTLPNISDTSTVTPAPSTSVLSTIGSNGTSCRSLPFSSKKPAAVGVGVGVPCGLALLGAVVLLWRLRTRELSAVQEAQAWKGKYDAVKADRSPALTGVGNHTHELVGWGPNEIDGRLVHEALDRE